MLVFNQMLILLLLLLVGVGAAKTGIIDGESNRRFSRFTVAIPQSALILSSAMNMELEVTAKQIMTVLGAGCVMYVLLVAYALAVPRIARLKRDGGLYSFMTLFGNVSFMGFPVIRALFGNGAIFYAALLSMPFNLLAYTLGIRFVSGERQEKFDWRKAINPPLVSALASVVMVFLPVSYPGPLKEAMGYLGDMVVPMSMIIIGASLGEQKIKDVFGDWHVYAFAPVRLLIAPALIWAVMRLIVHDPVLLGVMTVMEAMPVAAITTMLSLQYGANERLASRTVFVTTVLSVVTIPLVCWLLL